MRPIVLAFLARLEASLLKAEVVRLRDRGWVSEERFREDVGGLLQAFIARGGQVEYRSHHKVIT